MEVDSQRYMREGQTSNCRTFRSINHPSSQSRKMSIGVVVDSLEKKKSGVTRKGEFIVPNTEMVKSHVGNTIQGKSKEEEVPAAKKTKRKSVPEQVKSPWICTKSFHTKMPISDAVLHAKQSPNFPSGSGKPKHEGARNAPLAYSVQFSTNQTSFLQSDGKNQKKLDGISYRKRGVKDGPVEIQDFTLATAQEVIMSDREVVVNRNDATENRTETLRTKLWEILGTVSSPDDQLSKSQPHKVSDDNLNLQKEYVQVGIPDVQTKKNPDKEDRIFDEKGDACVKTRQSSDTIEMDSESPDNISKRPVTRSLSRKRAPTKKQQTSAKNAPSLGYKLKSRVNNTFSFEQERCEKLHGSSKSMQKKGATKSFVNEYHGICLPEKDKLTKNQQAINRSETLSPAKQANSVGKKIGDFHVGLPDNERHPELEKVIQEQEIFESPLENKKCKGAFYNPENKDRQEGIGNPSLKNGVNAEDDYLKTPVSSSSPSSIPKSDQMADASSPASPERRFSLGDIHSFRTLWTPKQDCSDHEQTKSSDDVVELKDFPLRKATPDMEEKDAEDDMLLSSSEDRDLRSCEEGSPIIQGHDWTGEDNWIEEPSDSNQVDGLARAVELFASELEKLKTKMKSATSRKSSEILMSVAAEVHMQLQNAESQIQSDVGKLTNLSKSKRKRLETKFEEQQEQLKVIYEKFKEQVNQHLRDCRSTLEGLEVYQTECKSTVEKQKASHKKLLLQVEGAVETQLNDAQKRIQVIQEITHRKMLQLRNQVALCLKEGIIC